jgi:hypothetical protein
MIVIGGFGLCDSIRLATVQGRKTVRQSGR